MKSNAVIITCPHCGEDGDPTEISCSPFAAGTNSSFYREVSRDKSSIGKPLAAQGEITCDECGEVFLYRLRMKVICESARLPDYRESKKRTAS